MWSRCLEWDETADFGLIRVVSVSGVGRDCWFSGILCGLGAWSGTRLLVSGESVLSRCLRWDETTDFRRFRVVSVPEVGRDCRFSGNLCGLGAWRGTRLLVFGESVWSRCLKWDETAGFGESVWSWCLERDETADFGLIRVVSVPGVGRDCAILEAFVRKGGLPRQIDKSITLRK